MTNKMMVAGTQTGLDTMIRGVKKMRPRMAPVRVSPARRRKTEAVMRRVKMPPRWAELGPRSWSFWRNAAEREGLWAWAWAGLGYWSAMPEGLNVVCVCV